MTILQSKLSNNNFFSLGDRLSYILVKFFSIKLELSTSHRKVRMYPTSHARSFVVTPVQI